MEPTILIGEYVEIDHDAKFDEIKVGEIIAFHRTDTSFGSILVQRIVYMEQDENNKPHVVWTNGDADIREDDDYDSSNNDYDFAVTEKDYVGKVFKIYPDRLSAKNKENGRMMP